MIGERDQVPSAKSGVADDPEAREHVPDRNELFERGRAPDDGEIRAVGRPVGLADVSSSTRGALPSTDERASVPIPIQPSKTWPSEIAISPEREIESRRASGSQGARTPAVGPRHEDRSGLPSHAAL